MLFNPDAMFRLWWLVWFGHLTDTRPRKDDDE